MSRRLRSPHALLAVALLAGCAVAPSPVPTAPAATATMTPQATHTPDPASPEPTLPAATPSVAPSSQPPPVIASVPPGATQAWTRIQWRKLAAGDPLAQVRSMIRWQGGFVALGDPAAVDGGEPTAIDEPVHTRVWVSADGVGWNLLDAGALGPRTIVLGVGATADGIAALTLQAGTASCDPPLLLDCWNLAGPLESWTSSDATSWTAHPGPAVVLPPEMNGQDGGHPVLRDVTAPRLVVTSGARQVAISRDGVAWTSVPASAFPAGWRLEDLVAFGSDLVAVGRTATKPLALTSSGGRTWTRHVLPTACGTAEKIVAGPAGLIVVGTTEGDGTGVFPSGWCSSVDGRHWRSLPGLPPLGTMPVRKAQECWRACPDGSLRGDGERMVAYRGWGKRQAGWTSLDGRTWARLAFTGRPETSTYWLDDHCTQNLLLLPVGLTCVTTDGSTLFGEPRS